MESIYYDLFELMSREHGVILLDTELQEIVQVAAKIEQDAEVKMYQRVLRNLVDEQNGPPLLNREAQYLEALREATELLSAHGV